MLDVVRKLMEDSYVRKSDIMMLQTSRMWIYMVGQLYDDKVREGVKCAQQWCPHSFVCFARCDQEGRLVFLVMFKLFRASYVGQILGIIQGL